MFPVKDNHNFAMWKCIQNKSLIYFFNVRSNKKDYWRDFYAALLGTLKSMVRFTFLMQTRFSWFEKSGLDSWL